jgi:hypothetical protein
MKLVVDEVCLIFIGEIKFLYFNLESSMLTNTHYTTIHDDDDADDDVVKCAPKKGDWNGGDEILMIIPKLDKRKGISLFY